MISRKISVHLFNCVSRRAAVASYGHQHRNSSSNAINIAVESSRLSNIFSNASLTKYIEDGLIYTQEHLHWTPSILCMGLGLRLLFSGFTVHGFKSIVKYRYVMAALGPRLKELEQAIRVKGAEMKWTRQQIDSKVERGKNEYIKETCKLNNCHPMKAYNLGMLQMPFWLSCTFALRNIATASTINIPFSPAQLRLLTHNQALADFAQTDFLWIPSLATPDPYYILPILLTSVILCNVQLRRMEYTLDKRVAEPTMSKVMSGFLVGFGIIAGLACSQMPSAIGLFWLSTSSFAFLTSLLLKNGKVQRLLNIAPIPGLEHRDPFRRFLKSIGLLFTRKR